MRKKLDTENDTPHQLAQKQRAVRPYLIGNNEKRNAQKANNLDNVFIHVMINSLRIPILL